MKKIILLLSCLFNLNLIAQNFWTKKEGSTYLDHCNNMTVDRFGNIFIILTTYEDIIIDNVLYKRCGNPGALLIKYSPVGKVLWVRRICVHTAEGLTTDANGNCFISGFAIGGLGSNTFENEFGTDVPFATTAFNPFLVKYSAIGELLWQKVTNGHTRDMVADGFGNLYAILDATTYFPYKLKIAITKSNGTGNEIWNISTDTVQLWGADQIAVDNSDNVYIHGNSDSTFTFGANIVNPGNNPTSFITKIDTTGNVLWVNEDLGGIMASQFEITPFGNIILSGTAFSSATLGTVSIKKDDWLIAKFNSSGNNIWVNPTSAPVNFSLKQETIYSTGAFYDTVKFYNNGITLYGKKQWCFYIMRLDSSGKVQQTYQHTGQGQWQFLNHIKVDPFGNIITAGWFTDTLNLGATLYCKDTGVNRGDVFVAKLPNDLSVGISENENETNVGIFPNPSNGVFTLVLTNKMVRTKISVYNTMGTCILSKEGKTNGRTQIDLTGQSKGIYFVEIHSENGKVNKRVVLE